MSLSEPGNPDTVGQGETASVCYYVQVAVIVCFCPDIREYLKK